MFVLGIRIVVSCLMHATRSWHLLLFRTIRSSFRSDGVRGAGARVPRNHLFASFIKAFEGGLGPQDPSRGVASAAWEGVPPYK